jgi:hypothetical protein
MASREMQFLSRPVLSIVVGGERTTQTNTAGAADTGTAWLALAVLPDTAEERNPAM